ncbi:MAG: ATP synthase F1 subunit delta [Acidobacteria bacterium]|nr:ATP synthase F1 subunit delta [Acidobacteriota bacterium]
MSTRASAARYARALLDVVITEGDPEQVEQDVSALAEQFAGNPELQKALKNPSVPVTAKHGVVEHLVSRMKPSPVLGKLMLMLADRGRMALLPEIAAIYRERLMEHRQIVRAEVTTAVPLAPERVTQIQARLTAATGRRVTMTTSVDPSLIGGAVARVGGIVYDGSIATQLAKMRVRLEEQR